MPPKVDLYDSSYGNYSEEVYRQVRIETYGEDLGQTSWVTQTESAEIPQLLDLNTCSSVLEVGCGSGRYALHLAQKVSCRLIGLDINERGIQNANRLAMEAGLDSLARFERFDASSKLPFNDGIFDAVFSNDVFCHLPGRPNVLREMFRILRAGGRLLYSDALVVGGMISHEEIAVRSSIGFYVYSPPGENERLMERVGFQRIRVTDTTERAAQIAKRWYQAREGKKSELIGIEGAINFEGLQRFLSCVRDLTTERRLLRYLYLAERSADDPAKC